MNLVDPKNKHAGKNLGSIVIRIIEEQLEKAGAQAIANTHTQLDYSGVSHAARVNDSTAAQEASAAIDGVSNLGSLSDTLSSIVSKLACLVKVVDQVAKVRPSFF
jgi:hypothetical protein